MIRESFYISVNNIGNSNSEISGILGVETNYMNETNWNYLLTNIKKNKRVNTLEVFYNLLVNKFEELESKLGIEKSDISIWLVIEYDGECNIVLEKEELKYLSDLGINFCISIYKMNLKIEFALGKEYTMKGIFESEKWLNEKNI